MPDSPPPASPGKTSKRAGKRRASGTSAPRDGAPSPTSPVTSPATPMTPATPPPDAATPTGKPGRRRNKRRGTKADAPESPDADASHASSPRANAGSPVPSNPQQARKQPPASDRPATPTGSPAPAISTARSASRSASFSNKAEQVRVTSPTAVSVIEAHLDGEAVALAKAPKRSATPKRVRMGEATTLPAPTPPKPNKGRRKKSLAAHRQGAGADGRVPGSDEMEPGPSQTPLKRRTTANSLKTPVSPGLPDPPPRRRRRRPKDPFDRPSKTVILNNYDGWFPGRGFEDQAVVWVQKEGVDIVSPLGWRSNDAPAIPYGGPALKIEVDGLMGADAVLDAEGALAGPAGSTSTLDQMLAEGVERMALADGGTHPSEPPSLHAPSLESGGSLPDDFRQTVPTVVPLKTGEEPPTAGGINIPRSGADEEDDVGTMASQESYRHLALAAHVREARMEEDSGAWAFRDMGDDSLASPSSTDRFVFPEPDGTEPPPVPSPSRRPSLRPQGHGRVPSVSAINTAVPRPAAPPSTSNFATSHLVRGKALGKGSHGSVYLVQDRDSAELYALKEILPQADPKMHRQVMGSLWEEMRLLSNLKHDNVVQVVRLVYNGASPASTSSATSSATPWTPLAPAPQMLMEYVSGGSIASLIRSLDPLPFPEALAAHLGRQVAKGLAYLHSMNVIHRDIKGANVLVTPAGTAKISDFGISLDVSDYIQQRADGGLLEPEEAQARPAERPGGKGVYSTIARTELKGTCFFMAPEATKKHYSAKVDIWSFGCLVLEMLSGRAPWPHCEAFTVLRWLYRGENLPPPLPPVIGDDAAPPYPPPTDRGDRGFLNPSTPHISHSAGVDAIGLGIINLSKRSIVVTREARALLDLCLRVDPAARPTATDLVCFSPFLAPRPYDFVAEWPRLLDAARTLQPAAAAASDGTAVHDPADLEEEEEDDEDGECEGTEYEGESGEDDECPEGCDCEYCHEDGDDHEDGEAEAGPSRAPEEAAPKSSPDEDGNDDAGTLR